MSNINNIRIVNLNYNNNTMKIDDETFFLNGENSMFNLRNGGGKSVLVQMMMAPFVTKRYRDLADRTFDSYFTTRIPTYIMVEWNLEEGAGYLLTGMMIKKKESLSDIDSKDTLDIINFVHEYKNKNEYDIRRFPIIEQDGDSKKLKSFQNAKRLFEELKKNISINFNYYDMNNYSTSKAYFDKLMEYGINHKEWESIIKKINLKESGLSELFKDAKNSEGLIKTWFLPTIEKKLSKDEDRIKNYKEMINKYVIQYKANKNNIDKKQKIDIFNEKAVILKELANDYLYKVQIEDNHMNVIGNTVDYLSNSIVIKEEEVESINSKLNSIVDEKREIKYEELSMNVYNNIDKIQLIEDELNLLNKDKSKLEEAKNNKIKERNILNCAKLYEEYTDISKKILLVENKIKVLKEEQIDKKPRINDLGYTILNIKQKNYDKIDFENKELLVLNNKLEDENSKISEKAKLDNNALININKNIGIIETEKNSFDKLEEKYNITYNKSLSRNLEGYYDEEQLKIIEKELNADISSFEEKIKNIEIRFINLKEEIKARESEKNICRDNVTRNEEILKNYNQKLIKYNNELEERKDIIKYAKLSEDEILNNKLIIQMLEKQLISFDEDIRELYKELEVLEVNLNNLSSGNILKLSKEIEDAFRKKDINIVYGIKWLKKNGYSLEKNIEIINNNPFIPYSIILTKEEINILKKEKIDVFTSNPITILEREKLESAINADDSNIINFDGINFYLAFNNKLLDETELNKLINECKSKIQEVENKISDKISSKDLYNNKKVYIQTSDLSEKAYNELNKNIENTISNTEDNNKKIISLNNIIAELENEIDKNKKDLDNYKESIRSTVNIKNDFSELCKEYLIYKKNKKLLIEENEKLNVIKNEIEKNEEILLKNTEKIKNNTDLIYSFKNELNKLNEDIQKFKIYTNGNIIYSDLEDLISEYESLVFEIKNSEYELINEQKELNEKHSKTEQELIERSTEYNIVENDYRNVVYDYRKLSTAEKQIDKLEEELNKLQEKIKEFDYNIVEIRVNNKNIINDIKELVGSDIIKERSSIFVKNFKEELINLNIKEKELKENKESINKLLNDLKINKSSLDEFNYEISEKLNIDYSSVILTEYIAKLKRDNRINIDNINKAEKILESTVNKIKIDNMFTDDKLFIDAINGLISCISDPNKFIEQLDIIVSSYKLLMEKLIEDISMINKERDNIIENLLEYISLVHNNIDQLDDNSSIDINDKRVKMLNIELPDWEENKELFEIRVKQYIELLKEQCIELLEQNESINELIDNRVNLIKIYDEVVIISNIKIKLFKIEENRQKQITWDEVSKNSGGEGFLSAFVILSCLLSYMRKDESSIFSKKEESKVVIMDNPFAQTNAVHLLKPLMDISKKSKTQLICLTGLGGDSIYSRFDNIYVLNLVNSQLKNGLKIMRSNHLVGDEEKEVLVSTHTRIEDGQIKLF